jgi:hypothetical protein
MGSSRPFRSACGRAAHGFGGGQHGIDDVLISGAAAEVPLERVAHLRLRRAGIRGEQVGRAHDHPGRAEAALKAVLLPERRLQRVHRPIGRQRFDRGDLMTFGLHGQHGAALHGLAVEVYGAGAALAGIAADMGAGQVELVADHVAEQGAGLHVHDV